MLRKPELDANWKKAVHTHALTESADGSFVRPLSGLFDVEVLKRKPRVLFGYLSAKDWAFVEFLCFLHASWRYVTSMAQPTGYRIDLVVFAEGRWLREVAALCQVLDLDELEEDDYNRIRRLGNAAACFVVPYPRAPPQVWQNYPFVSSYHFLADERVQRLLGENYGYALKTDLDCFITPTLIHHFPQQLEVGYMPYTPHPTTGERLRAVAASLGLTHAGIHDIGPTWYGDVPTLLALASASLPLVHHLLDRHFDKAPDGSWRQNWAQGEGWPLWSKDMAVMYAPDILLSHMVQHWERSKKYDVHGDSERYTFALYHIHLQHGDGDFSKFEFFKHHYDGRDITQGLDFNLVRDYALWLAVSTWRHVRGGQAALQAGAGAGGLAAGAGSG
ncbi:hypothetical protein HYH03_000138 [Edaphochlamys debaryana]|uniref:DUF7164 domain-containing protein n=1 Tax=Edaphochlamys debaryana TaxID=47281 RepID=A0A835YFA2_9CHLO|nr:hypothetical protein HYH03_000138 [Edaphochlamys debaryana]|eukprot:KAG2501633.1 hypothetical protein HYH03_000138 [Edaphochlamys debaryana]